MDTESPQRTLKSFLPILSWLPNYQTGWLRGDVIAALTIWALLVPEAMAYAGIAGLPPAMGLYAIPLALIAYAILGSSRHLNVGPSSAVAALSFTVVSGLAIVGSDEFVLYSIALAFVVGIMLIVASLLRLGILADFLSRPVLDGFIVGVAVSIAVGQLDKLLGFKPLELRFVPDILVIASDIGMTHIPTLVVGAISLGLLFVMHRFTPKLPGAIIVLFLAIFTSSLLDFEGMGIHIVGEIPAGLPPFGIPEALKISDLLAVAPGAIGVALVAFAESVAIARSVGIKFGYEVDANQELVALGAANLGSGFSGGFTGNGSLSRTSAGTQAGANSQMVSLIAAAAILITAVALTPLFFNLPEATLGAIVIHAVWHNINYRRISRYLGITNLDFVTSLIAAIGVLALGALEGLLIASFLGLMVLLLGTKKRNTSALGKIPGSDIFRSLENYPEGETYPGLLILRFDGTLFFANAPDFVIAAREAYRKMTPPPRVVIIDGESINEIDATAVFTLKELSDEMARSGVELWFAAVKTRVRDVMVRANLEEAIRPEHFYASIQDGVDDFLKHHA
jgi:high affinity sulfate transporter 1